MYRIILMGPQGSGKTTQGHALSQRLNVPYLSTGDLIRAEMAEGTPFGQGVASMMNQGHMVSDLDVVLLLGRKLDQHQATGWILDGYPRRISQAQLLVKRWPPTNVVELQLERRESYARLSRRGREDDSEEAIAQRLAEYEESTIPTIHWLFEQGYPHSTFRGSLPIHELTEIILLHMTSR